MKVENFYANIKYIYIYSVDVLMWYWNLHGNEKWYCWKISYNRALYLKNRHDNYQYMWYVCIPLCYLEYRWLSMNLVFAQKEAQIFFMWTKIAFQYISFPALNNLFLFALIKNTNSSKYQQKISITKLSNAFMFFCQTRY